MQIKFIKRKTIMATSLVHAEISSLLYHFHRASDEYYEQTWNTWKTKT